MKKTASGECVLLWSISSDERRWWNNTSTVLRPRDACVRACATTSLLEIERLFFIVNRSTTNSRPVALSLLSATCLPYHLSSVRRLRRHRFHFHRPPRGELAPINFLQLRRATGVERRLTLGKYASSSPLVLCFHSSRT